MSVHRQLIYFVLVLFLRPVLLDRPTYLARTRKVIKVEYYENCEQKTYPMTFVKFSFTRNRTVLFINGEEIISRDIKNPIKLQFRIEKCKDKSNPDTCEYYTTWRWDEVCASFNLPFVKAFTDAHYPPITCPLKKNHHYIKNAKLQADLLEAFLAHSQSIVLWKFRIKLFEGPLTVACIDMGLRLVETRIKV